MALRENEKDLILCSKVSKKVRETLASEKKVMEGYPLRIIVKTKTELNDIIRIIKIIDVERKLNLFE